MDASMFEEETDTFPEGEQQPDDESDDGRKSLEALLHRQRRDALIAAYARWFHDPVKYEPELYLEIIKFAQTKLYRFENEFKDTGSPRTMDDCAQQVAIDIWRQIRAHGNRWASPAAFYAYLNRTVYKAGRGFVGYLLHYRNNKVPLLIEDEDEDGQPEQRMPQALYGRLFNGPKPDLARVMQPWMRERDKTDQNIIMFLMAGKSVTEVASIISITPRAVEKRIAKLKQIAASNRDVVSIENASPRKSEATDAA